MSMMQYSNSSLKSKSKGASDCGHPVKVEGRTQSGQSVQACLSAGEKLASLVVGRSQTVLGWFVCRRDLWATPSLRDRAVCEALPSCLDRLQPQRKERQVDCEDPQSTQMVQTYEPVPVCSQACSLAG